MCEICSIPLSFGWKWFFSRIAYGTGENDSSGASAL